MKQKNDSLGDRMKNNYELRSRTYLTRRTPVIIRLDGCAFHTFTRGFDKPFDEIMIKSMQDTTKYLCENIQGCIMGYTQSDEITLVLVDYQKFETSAWYDNEIQKICSVSASMATLAFNRAFVKHHSEFSQIIATNSENEEKISKLMAAYNKAIDKGATFDSRCFSIPKEEVTNCVFWRQLDAIRNSIQGLAQCHYSAKALYCTNTQTMKRMLLENQGIDWETLPPHLQHGSACIKDQNGHWFVDENIPILRGNDRVYLDDILVNYETSDITKS